VGDRIPTPQLALLAKAPGQTRAMNKSFRLKWAEQEYEKITVIKSKLQEYQIVNNEIGTERVVHLEGGRDSPAAWRAGINYVNKCCELGGMWVAWNSFTQRPEVMYVKKQRLTSFTQAWRLYSEQKSIQENAKFKRSSPAPAEITPGAPGVVTPAALAAGVPAWPGSDPDTDLDDLRPHECSQRFFDMLVDLKLSGKLGAKQDW
jgi:hypothetical protein